MTAKITIIQEDITRLSVDAIVNAANNSLLGGGGVDGAIHRAAGPELKAECSKLKGCRTGDAKITQGYNLPAKHVIHTVGPRWYGGGHGEAQLLASCYKECLARAGENGIRSIAFPAVSCGVYGYPLQAGCQIAMQTVAEEIGHYEDIRKVIFCAFSEEVYHAFVNAMQSLQLH
ncbi:O-acetyl-ADP-ribose deacetylase [Alteromonas sp. a30]|uniref:O-acetyl-ADP-ribose deacetylase n=1 Tax=Alteromonas sp. a30 TaxID=2730917 RepID=UPI002280E686|nr:O-acetyl-ADP-ribose deacetylase [Alteromonas sp. a30]MCY7296136.1 O-acetyl-ADP-ribose deacetylase [Alteromonas sp. a30]